MAAAFWNANAERYACKSVVNPGAFERKIDVTKSLMPRSVVPDIGCGTGSLALRLAPFCSPRPWARCSQRDDPHRERQDARPEDRKRDLLHRFVRRQLHRVRRRKSRWNLRVQLLHLFEDRPAALAWVDRLLKPGSFLVSSTVCLGKSRIPYGAVLRLMRWLGKAPLVKIFSKHVIDEEIRQAGFVDLVQPDVGAEPRITFVVASKLW